MRARNQREHRVAPEQRVANIIVPKPEAEQLLHKPLEGRQTDYYVLSEKRTRGVPKNLGGPYSSLGKATERLRQVEYFKRVKPSRGRNPASWTSPKEAAEYALKRWGHAHYLSGRDSYRRDPRDDTWRDFAAWIRKTGDPGADAAAAAIEHFPGLIIDFAVPVEPIGVHEIPRYLTPSSSVLNPCPPGAGELENLLGPLSQGHKEAILDYIDAPTEEGWDRIHGMFLTPGMTVSAWVAHVESTCPSSLPDAATVMLAIRTAADRRRPNRARPDDLGWQRVTKYVGVLHPGDYSSRELAPGIRYELRKRQVWDVWLVRGEEETRVASSRDLDGARRAAARDASAVLELAREISAVTPRTANPAPKWDLQTVIVSKDEAPTRAKATTIARDFAKRIYTSRETDDSWRFRQRPPTDFVEKSFRTRSIPGRGVSLVYGRLKRGAKSPSKRRA